jgi:hypothetical protein
VQTIAARRTPFVEVKCAGCGIRYDLSERRRFAYEKAGRKPLCADCQRPPTVKVTVELCQWWRDRYSPAEIRELAAGLEAWFD